MSFKLAIQFLMHEKSLDQNFNYDQSVAFLREATGFFFFSIKKTEKIFAN